MPCHSALINPGFDLLPREPTNYIIEVPFFLHDPIFPLSGSKIWTNEPCMHLPMSTSDCECCFSAMNRTKTDYRNQIHSETLDRLLRVKIEGPPLHDFRSNSPVVNGKKTQTFWKLIFPFFSVYNNYNVKTGDHSALL